MGRLWRRGFGACVRAVVGRSVRVCLVMEEGEAVLNWWRERAYCEESGSDRRCSFFLDGFDLNLLVHAEGEVPFYDQVGHRFQLGGGHVFGAFGRIPDVAHTAGHNGDNGAWSSISSLYLPLERGKQLTLPAITPDIFHELHIYRGRKLDFLLFSSYLSAEWAER